MKKEWFLTDNEISKLLWNEDGEIIDTNYSHVARTIAKAQVEKLMNVKIACPYCNEGMTIGLAGFYD